MLNILLCFGSVWAYSKHMDPIGKLLIISGIFLLLIGILYTLGFRGLPGDIMIKRDNFSFFFPIVTSLILSLLLTIILYLMKR